MLRVALCYDPLRFILSFADLFSLFSFAFHGLRHHPPINDWQIDANMIHLYNVTQDLRHHLSENDCLQPLTIMGLKRFTACLQRLSWRAAFGFAPFKAEQLVSHKTLDTIYLKMVAFQPLTVMGLKRFTACLQRLSWRAAFGSAPFKAEQLVLHKTLDTI